MEICPANISKYNSICKKQITLLMIQYDKGWHYLAVKQLPVLLRGITLKHNGDLYCLNCLHSRTENKFKCHEKVCKNKEFCGIFLPTQIDKSLKFNRYMKSDKTPRIIYVDLKSLIKKIDICKNIL